MVYIDLNMIRAGVVNHPGQWKESGFSEIQKPPKRYAIIDYELERVERVCGTEAIFKEHIDSGLSKRWAEPRGRDDRWSEAIAVGSLTFVEKIKGELGSKRRLTDLPRGVDGFEWSPDSRRLVVSTASLGATREEDAKRRGKGPKREPGSPPESDYRYIDRLGYLFNGTGFIYDRVSHLWLVDAESGDARRLTDGPTSEEEAAWAPDSHVEHHRGDRRVVQIGAARGHERIDELRDDGRRRNGDGRERRRFRSRCEKSFW